MILENIYFQDYEHIDYQQFNDNDLKQLVLDFKDPFIATSALTELSIRQSDLISDLSDTILNSNLGDKYLQSIAYKSLYEFDQAKAIEYIKNNYAKCDKRILLSILETIVTDLEFFKNSLSLKILANKTFDRFKRIPKKEFSDSEGYDWIIKELKF